MCERCTIIESAFGLRDPLPPRVASSNAETTITDLEDGHNLRFPAKDDTDVSFPGKEKLKCDSPNVSNPASGQLWMPDDVELVCQPPASMLPGIRDSRLAPHRQ